MNTKSLDTREDGSVYAFKLDLSNERARSLLQHLVDFVLVEIILVGKGRKDLRRAHRVAHHSDFLVCALVDEVD
jgi:hypothetical protein